MTTATLHTHAPVRTNAVLDYLHRLQDAYTAWRNEQSARAALSALSDYELKDIGITRSDIDYASRKFGAQTF